MLFSSLSQVYKKNNNESFWEYHRLLTNYIQNKTFDYKIFFTFADLDKELNIQKQYDYK